MKKKLTKKEWKLLVFNAVIDAKTESDLEEAAELADEAVALRKLTRREVDEIFDDFEPSLLNN